MLRIGDCVSDDTLEEGLQNTAGLLIDHGGDTLDTATAGKTSDGWLGDTLDVVSQNLAVSLCAALAKTLASLSKKSTYAQQQSQMIMTYFSASSHDD